MNPGKHLEILSSRNLSVVPKYSVQTGHCKLNNGTIGGSGKVCLLKLLLLLQLLLLLLLL